MQNNKKVSIEPHQRTIWLELTPSERLKRSWAMRSRLKNPKELHDKKIFPKP